MGIATVVPEFLRTLGFVSCVRFRFASCVVSPSRDMSGRRRVDQSLSVTYRIPAVTGINALLPSGNAPTDAGSTSDLPVQPFDHGAGADAPPVLDGMVVRQARGGLADALAQAPGGLPGSPLLRLGGDLFGPGQRRFARLHGEDRPERVGGPSGVPWAGPGEHAHA
jgi:hypothetical protein